jgi:hypothetical protein
MDLTDGQQRFILDDPADLVLSRDVGSGEHGDDPVRFGGRRGVEPNDSSARDGRGEDSRMQHTRRFGQIADKE